jgi:hypothetical protein
VFLQVLFFLFSDEENIIDQLLLKNQVFTTHLMVRPLEETEELAVGDLELHITRKENQEKAEKGSIYFHYIKLIFY